MEMQSIVFPPYPFPPGLWHFHPSHNKAMELPVHPAFLHTPYPNYPLSLCSPGQHSKTKTKSDSFSIDAILNRDRADEVPRTPEEKSYEFDSHRERCPTRSISPAVSRRYLRLHGHSHPYFTPENKRSTGPVCSSSSLESKFRQQFPILSSPESTSCSPTLEGTEPKAQNGKGEWKQSKGKRIRTIFTPEQLDRLEAEFDKQQYMVGTERYYLACSLNLTEAQVKVWFQNRRIKWRKQNLEQQQAKLANFDLFREQETDSVLSEDTDNFRGQSPSF